FDDGDALQAHELANLRTWLNDEKPNAAWARRYGGDFDATIAFIESSERRRNRFAPIILPLIGLATLVINAFFSLGAWAALVSDKNAPALLMAEIGGATPAITCACGFALYRGFDGRKALLSGVAIFFAEALACVGSIYVDKGAGLAEHVALNWWNIGLAAPAAVGAMAIFDPDFRRLSRWLPLVASWSIFALFVTATARFGIYAAAFALIAIWCAWCALLGFQLRRRGEAMRPEARRRAVAALQLGSIFVALYIVLVIWAFIVMSPRFGADADVWPWWALGIPWSAALGASLAFGLGQYRKLGDRRSALAGGAVVALVYVGYSATLFALLSLGLARPFAGVLAYLSVAPSALAGLAVFDRAFTRPWVWLLVVAVLDIPYAAVALLLENSGKPNAQTTGEWLALLIAGLWVATIGYLMRRLPSVETLPQQPARTFAGDPLAAVTPKSGANGG
ncbi:MAG: hypothetical protein ACLPN5_04320, partial [Roseiarcus sp.]